MKTQTFIFVSFLGLVACESEPAVAPSDAGSLTDLPVVDRSVTDGPAPDTGFPCASLGSLCHEVDPGSGPLHDCHEGGHDANPAWCAANAERCYQLCTAAHANVDGGTSDGATVRDASTATDGGAVGVACTLVGSYCHAVDPGNGPIHDCHEMAHAGDAAWCAANVGRCYALCSAARADAGSITDAGPGPDPVSVACTLVGSYCHAVDPGNGPIHDCHEMAHAGDAAWCSANVGQCYALCSAARAADAGSDASATDAVASDVHQH